MAADIAGFPFFEVQFNQDGVIFNPAEVNALVQFLAGDPGVTDLFVFSHGWNNDMGDARSLMRRFFGEVRGQLDAGGIPGLENRRFAVAGVLWPSKKFADRELIASGAASLGGPLTDEVLADDLRTLVESEDERFQRAETLLPRLEDSPSARREFVEVVRSLVPPGGENDEEGEGAGLFRSLDGDEVLKRLGTPVELDDEPAGGAGGALGMPPGDLGGEQGQAAGLGDVFGGILGGARNLLNLATYYQMKERAGAVGRKGVHQVLQAVRGARPDLRLHLIGHSFGARVVTAAALGPENAPNPLPVDSLTLLQAAFSHYGFARGYEGGKDGAFRPVVTGGRVRGPIVITCTPNDTSVGLAYPLASQLARQIGSFLGDAKDKYGGLGRNGAQKTPEAKDGTLLALEPGAAYAFAPGGVYNLKADAFIKDHSDICKPQVARALLSAVTAGS